MASKATYWSGALPRPADMEEYNRIIPDGAERLMRLVEKEQDHRIAIEQKALPTQMQAFRTGQHLGFWLSVLAIVIAVVGAYLGVDWRVCVAIVGVPVLSVAKALVDAFRRKDPE